MESTSRYLPPHIRQYIVIQVEQAVLYEDIVEKVHKKFGRIISKGTISKLYSKYLDQGTVFDQPKSGRPNKLSNEMEEELVARVEEDRTLTANAISRDPKLNPSNASSRTITRVLNNKGLYDATSIPKIIPDINIETRFQFALSCKEKKLDWALVIFSDESDLFPDPEGKVHYRKYIGEVVDIDTGPQYRWDPCKVKVWAAMSEKYVGPIIRYSDNLKSIDYVRILEENLIPYFPFLRGTRTRASKYYFQQDNAGAHRGIDVEKWFENNHITKLNWPGYSPDLNPLENIWAFIKGELYKKNNELKTADQTWQEIQKIWKHEVNCMLEKLYKSMYNRIEEVINMEGKRINY